MTLLIPLALLQVGPSSAEMPMGELRMPTTDRTQSAEAAQPVPVSSRLAQCFAETRRDAAAGRVLAEAWVAEGTERGNANRCLGVALASQDDWSGAYRAFIAARDATAADEGLARARLGALAGNAALAAGEDAAALAALETAQADALSAGNAELAASLAIDRATALVGMGNEEQAAQVLDRVRADDPENGQAWLLSATLARRTGNLDLAQQQIVEAARLLPGDPLVGLEAGVIAVLAGREDAARKSWQSVIELAPEGEAAATARDYLSQLESE